MTKNFRAAAWRVPVLLLVLGGCAAPRLVLMPGPPAEVSRETLSPGPPAASAATAAGAPAPAATVPAAGRAPAALPSPDPARYAEAIARTREAASRGAARDAVPFWEALEKSPWSADAIFNQGVLLHLAGDIEGAMARYRRVTDNTPVHEPAAANLLGIYLLRGAKDEAAALVSRIAPDPSSPPAGLIPELKANIAAWLVETGDLERAAALFHNLRTQGTATPASSWNMAVLSYKQGDLAAARRAAGELPPAIRSLWPVAVSRLAWEGNPAKVPVMDHVPADEPMMAVLSRNLAAFSLAAKGDPAAAERVLASLAEGGSPPRAEILSNLGLVRTELGKWAEARAALEAAVEKEPGLPEGWLNLGVFREVYEGDPSGAAACYEKYVKLKGRRSDEVRTWAEWLQKSSSPPQP